MRVRLRIRECEIALSVALAFLNEQLPRLVLTECGRVANDKEEVPCPSDGDIHAPLVNEETQTSLETARTVTAHTAYNDDIFLSSLKCINSVDFNEII